jgi:TonB family protein
MPHLAIAKRTPHFAFLAGAVFLMSLGAANAQQEQNARELRAGKKGVGVPKCLYCPGPEYSEEAVKAKFAGEILLDVTVTSDGRVIDPVVVKGPGLGLEEKALEQARNWKMTPAPGPNGKPVNCRVQVLMTWPSQSPANAR